MPFVQQMAAIVAPWQSLYSDHIIVSTTVTTVHIITLLLAGGLAISADRAVLRALRRPVAERQFQLEELGAVHRPVLIALTFLVLSGILLAAADVETFATSAVFWLKMGLVSLLLANGLQLRRVESRLEVVRGTRAEDEETEPDTEGRLWRRLGAHARASMTLWLIVAIAGTVLTNM